MKEIIIKYTFKHYITLQQMIEKDSQILARKAEAEKKLDDLKKKMKEDKVSVLCH